MTMASLLGPDKPHIKASSDIHLSLFITLSDFFFKKNVVTLTPSTKNHHNVSVTTISVDKWSDELNHRPRSRKKIDHSFLW